MPVCYRHPRRETAVACSSCGRSICPDCMTPTPVGMRCPECARERTKVKTASTLRDPALGRYSVTQILIAINVLVFLAETATGTPLGGVGSGGVGTLYVHGFLVRAVLIDGHHEYYRLLTSGFLHDGLLHILFNMVFLYFVGPSLEAAVGKVNFVAIYFASLLAGSFGALLFTPRCPHRGSVWRAVRAAGRARRRRPLPRDLDLVQRPRPDAADQHRVLADDRRHLDRLLMSAASSAA